MRGPWVRGLVALAIVAVALLGIKVPAPAHAQSRESSVALRQIVVQKLSRAAKAQEEGDYAKALEELDKVKRMKDLDSHEKATLYDSYARLFMVQEKYEEAIHAFEAVLQQEKVAPGLEERVLYSLAQLELVVASDADSVRAQRGYQKAVGYLERWLASAENPGPQPLVLLGRAYYMVGRIEEAVEPVRRAIQIAQEREQTVQEGWYGLLRLFYFDLEDYPKLLEVLETLVTRFPSKEYWLHLATAYGQMGDPDRQLAAYEVAFEQGYLESGRELLVFSQLLAQADVPYRAAVVLDKALNDGVVEGTVRNWRYLSQFWSMAHEDARAIEALKTAAELSNDGELDARLAQSYANLGNWERAAEAARAALREGVKDAHEVQIMLGAALFELERYEEAINAFRAVLKMPDAPPEARESASRWIVFIESERERLRQLQESLD